MECLHASEVKATLRAPSFRDQLQKYINRFKADPAFLHYHQASILLSLREDLMQFLRSNGEYELCGSGSLHVCPLTFLLNEAIHECLAQEATMATQPPTPA
jgi:hypothetical protein